MTAAGKNIVFIVVLLLKGWACFSNTLPVLPFPQYVQQGRAALSFTTALSFESEGLSNAQVSGLQDHWKNFSHTFYSRNQQPLKLKLVLLKSNRAEAMQRFPQAGARIDSIGKEGYLLILNDKERVIVANTETGLFYGLQTLKQLTRGGWNTEIFIADWPSLANRVVYDDISRGPISTVGYIRKQIERLSEIKVNYLSFYIEHVVQPVSHPDFAPVNGKLTIADIKELSAYAGKYHMQLIGSFQSFGHFEKILALPQYRSMGETSTLISPLDPKARSFLEDVIGELCDAFSAPYFNVNCDETFDLTKGRSKAYIDSIGAARFYADHLRFLYDIVKRHHKKMMMWGDVALQHEEVLDLLPKDIIYLTWEYDDKHSFAPWITPFTKRNLEFMVCPGILNSYRMFPDMVMAKANINGFLEEGKKSGASGAITTIWDDGGAYMFSCDWYGVYVAAEKSWNVHTAASFDGRYELNAYGSRNNGYVNALFKLMELRSLPLTYNLSDQLWQQKLLPDSGKRMIENNSSAPAALKIVRDAEILLTSAAPRWNKDDINVLAFCIAQYKLIIDSRMILAAIAAQYQQINTADKATTIKMLKGSADSTERLETRYKELKERFRKAWLNENQPYWLDVVLAGYDRKIKDLRELGLALESAVRNTGMGNVLPPASALRLDIVTSPHYYFQNWMLGGPFPSLNEEKLPAFLYSEHDEYNKPPSPGDFTQYKGKVYRWQKFASQNGGVIDLDENYPGHVLSDAYAYCSVTTDSAFNAKAFVQYDGVVEVYCNGVKVLDNSTSGQDRSTERSIILLPLKKGANHILLKLREKKNSPWSFTFRLGENISVTNHKHKYTLNAKTKSYEAD